jgi:4-amino-4-deoxy-L-arabinose transferase-like glycosyltransferase
MCNVMPDTALSDNLRRRWEWPAVVGVMLVAAAFRLLALNDAPPGLHHDEVIIGQVAKDILRGHLAIYFTPGYGHEPMYHYIAAGLFAAIGASAFVLRLTSAFIAILGLAVTYRFTRRLFSPAVALGAVAWMAVSLWPVFFARIGLRSITLPLMSTLTAYFLWRALQLGLSSDFTPGAFFRPRSWRTPAPTCGVRRCGVSNPPPPGPPDYSSGGSSAKNRADAGPSAPFAILSLTEW